MDDDGILQLKEFHVLNAPHAINPVSVSDFSIIGKTSIRFESNHGECGQEPNPLMMLASQLPARA